MTDKPITFLAAFPAIQSAITAGDDGMRIQLQIPENEMAAAVGLIAWRGKVLRVTVAVEADKNRTESGQRDFTIVDA